MGLSLNLGHGLSLDLDGEGDSSYSESFLVSDWMLSAGFYSLTIQHQLESLNVLTQVYDDGNNVVGIHRLEIVDANNVKLYTLLNCRFAGKIIISK